MVDKAILGSNYIFFGWLPGCCESLPGCCSAADKMCYMVAKIMLGGSYGVLGDCEVIAIHLLRCCELLPGCMQFIRDSVCFSILLCSC